MDSAGEESGMANVEVPADLTSFAELQRFLLGIRMPDIDDVYGTFVQPYVVAQ
jgi:hypothetical protein